MNETVQFLEAQGFHGTSVGMVLGTGFGRFVDHLLVEKMLPYQQIPHFPVSTVQDHAGRLVCGRVSGRRVLAMQGRFHRYEGYTPAEVTFPIQVMRQLGVTTLIVTNAAGGLNPFFAVGDLMVIDDQIHMMGGSVLAGIDDALPPCIPSYSQRMNDAVVSLACANRITLRRGILAGMLGPAFETPAEIAMLRQLGADAVTMSTLPEVAMACALDMPVMGMSCIANLCVGPDRPPVRHEDVVAIVGSAVDRFAVLMRQFLVSLD